MAVEFVVYNKRGERVESIDPYESHREVRSGTYLVANGYHEYEVQIPDGGTFMLQAMAEEARDA